MFDKDKMRRFVLIGLLWAVTPAAANETPLFLIGAGESVSTSNISHGFSFALSQTLTVTGLGKIDANGNGLLDDTSAAEVALWNTETREQLVAVTLDDNIFLRENQFFASTNPTTIPPGNYTIGARYFVDQEPTLSFGSVAATPIEPQFDIVSGFTPKLGSGDGLSFPNVSRSRVSIGPTLLVDLPEVLITEPKTNRVNQRRQNGTGAVTVEGVFDNTIANSIEFRAVSTADPATDVTAWQAAEIVGNRFTGEIELPATGWYDVEIRSLDGGSIRFEHEVPNIGLGEVFITAGQSNSANHGAPPLDATSGHVYAMDEGGFWHPANDPQPIATGSGGTPWPVLGDLLVEELEVPVGIVSVGWGGTEVGEWLPGAAGPSAVPLYDRLRDALDRLGHEGGRAILWHQGEEDTIAGTTVEGYSTALEAVIAASRQHAGYEIPWGIAQAAFTPITSLDNEEIILAAQRSVIANDRQVFAGPLTDDLTGSEWRRDLIHFNEAGLRLHAERWFEAVLALVVPEPTSIVVLCSGLLAAFPFRRRFD